MTPPAAGSGAPPKGLARRLESTDTVYLTGRDPARVAESVHRLSNARAEVRGELLDVARPEAVERFADLLVSRHGGIDKNVQAGLVAAALLLGWVAARRRQQARRTDA